MATSRNTSSFVKADSRNLPQVNNIMILEYMAVSTNHNIAEIRGAKALMSSREAYLSSAVGYVEVLRTTDCCVVKAKVVPEHKVSLKMYSVTVKINETENVIEESTCDDCAAAAGGCKHSLLILFWLAKKSDEPSSTAVQCYWSKPKLSSARTEYLKSKDTYKSSKVVTLEPKNPNVLSEFLKECESRSISESLIVCLNAKESHSYNIFDMTLEFVQSETNHTFNHYKECMDNKITRHVKDIVCQKTLNQANNKYWHYLRQGRITASKLHEAACCNVEGTLVQQILGGYKVPDTVAMKRGRILEEQVKKEIENKLNVQIEDSGFILIDSVFGASPDGVTDNFVVEIKCPNSQKAMKTYVKDNVLQDKFKAQIHCQMLASGKNKGLFCMADPSFETNKNIYLYWVSRDDIYIKEKMEKALLFWKKYIFPKVLASAI